MTLKVRPAKPKSSAVVSAEVTNDAARSSADQKLTKRFLLPTGRVAEVRKPTVEDSEQIVLATNVELVRITNVQNTNRAEITANSTLIQKRVALRTLLCGISLSPVQEIRKTGVDLVALRALTLSRFVEQAKKNAAFENQDPDLAAEKMKAFCESGNNANFEFAIETAQIDVDATCDAARLEPVNDWSFDRKLPHVTYMLTAAMRTKEAADYYGLVEEIGKLMGDIPQPDPLVPPIRQILSSAS